MENMIRLVGPERAVEFLGIRLVGLNATNGTKLLFTLVIIVAALLLGALLRRLSRRVLRKRDDRRAEFWVGQGIKVATTSLQKVVTAVAERCDEPRHPAGLGPGWHRPRVGDV